MPTDIAMAPRTTSASDFQLVACFSLLPWLVSLLLAHAYPGIAGAFVMLGRLG